MTGSKTGLMSDDYSLIERTIRQLLEERGPDKTLCPSVLARHLAGNNEKEWRLLMKPIRKTAVTMARAGLISLQRKGKPADLDHLKGLYRIANHNPAQSTHQEISLAD